jgi:hypothetical protein
MVCCGGPAEPREDFRHWSGAKVGSSTNLQQGDRERTLEDMRHLKTALGMAAATCILGALAAPALAHEFVASKYNHTASPSEPFATHTKSLEETKQTFVFGRRTLRCEKATGKGVITEEKSSYISTHLVFSKCGYYPIPTKEEYIPAAMKGGLSIKFKVDGAGEFEGNGEGEELEYGTKAELLETAAKFSIGAGKYCSFVIPTQIVPARAKVKPEEEYSQVKYSNDPVAVEETPTKLKLYPGGFQRKVLATFELKPFKYKYAEETQCFEHEEKVEFGSGNYKGELLTEVVGGNLEFK